MIQQFVDAWFAEKDDLRQKWSKDFPGEYLDIVRGVVSVMPGMDPDRIHEIDDGDYQGTLVYVIGAQGYQPSDYWCARVEYGSCSGCDTLQALSDEDNETKKLDGLMTLALHIVQKLRPMFGGDA